MTPVSQTEPKGDRSFLMLQGPLSPLYARLADVFERAGHRVARVNFCAGDQMHWRRPGAINFRGRLDAFRPFIADLLVRRTVTDVVLHGECRSYHAIAIEEAHRLDVRVFVTELGYLRPDWLTLDHDGTGAASCFPRDPAAIEAIAAQCAAVDLSPRFKSHFSWVAIPDVVYNLANTGLWLLFPHYRRHTIDWPPLEYMAWLWRLASAKRRDRRAEAAIRSLAGDRREFFLMPLQLEGDFQVRVRSGFRDQREALELIADSFRAHAPPTASLVVKTHPLDNGLRPWAPVLNMTCPAAASSEARISTACITVPAPMQPALTPVSPNS